jgi:hypothetical protein
VQQLQTSSHGARYASLGVSRLSWVLGESLRQGPQTPGRTPFLLDWMTLSGAQAGRRRPPRHALSQGLRAYQTAGRAGKRRHVRSAQAMDLEARPGFVDPTLAGRESGRDNDVAAACCVVTTSSMAMLAGPDSGNGHPQSTSIPRSWTSFRPSDGRWPRALCTSVRPTDTTPPHKPRFHLDTATSPSTSSPAR